MGLEDTELSVVSTHIRSLIASTLMNCDYRPSTSIRSCIVFASLQTTSELVIVLE